jgi:RNA polymerase sigma-70 factor (ECF subfamily)
MDEKKILAERFEANRGYLRSVAYRMLGSRGDAEDAVQEAWLRLARADAGGVDNLKAWLTTVVSRVCLDMLRARKVRGEAPIAEAETIAGGGDVERETEVADSVGLAMLIVLETLAPAERVAFVLHDMFNMPFDVIAPLVNRSPAAARQLASRARRRVQGSAATPDADRARQRAVVEAFLAASRAADFSGLLAILSPDVVLRADAGAIAASLARIGDTPPLAEEVHGSAAVAKLFEGRARVAQVALIDGYPGLVIAPGGQPRMVFDFVVADERIIEISMIALPESIKGLDVRV